MRKKDKDGAERTFAALAKTPDEKAIFDVLTIANETGRPFIMSRRVPAERLEMMRASFDATMKDPDFLAAAAKQSLPVTPIGGRQAQEMIAHVYDAATHSTHVAVLDARRLADGPVARVYFDHALPLTFHGIWIPARVQ